VLLVEAIVDGVSGWGECVADKDPFYSPETMETAWIILRENLWPLIKSRSSVPQQGFGFAASRARPQHG